MDNGTTQDCWVQLETGLFCGPCKASKILIWDKLIGDVPHTIHKGDHPTAGTFHYQVHCDYFRKPVPDPAKLQRCGAFQRKGQADEEND